MHRVLDGAQIGGDGQAQGAGAARQGDGPGNGQQRRGANPDDTARAARRFTLAAVQAVLPQRA